MGILSSLFEKIESNKEKLNREKREEMLRETQLAEEETQRQKRALEAYACWYKQEIDAFLAEIKTNGFSFSGGFETYPFIDYDKPSLSYITREGDASIFEFTDVRGIALDNSSRKMLVYNVAGKKRAEYLRGEKASGNIVSYKLINYDRVLSAEHVPHYKYETKYDDSDAIASAIAGGMIDGLFGGRAGAYMAFGSASKPVVVTNEVQTGVSLIIKTNEPGYEQIIFRASVFKMGYSPMFETYCNPITDTVFRQSCAGVFSKEPCHVKEKVINRSNGTKKDFWLGLGTYVEPYKIEGRGDIEKAFAPGAQLGSVEYYFKLCAEEINQSIFSNVMTPYGVLGAKPTAFQSDDFDFDDFVSDDELLESYEESDDFNADDEGFCNEGGLHCTLNLVVEKSLTDELDPADFPTKRAFDVAFWLAWMEENDSNRPLEEYEQHRTERCHFIQGNPNLLAAKYLTYDGGYLYAQAVKDHFPLPFDIEEEDETPKTSLGELIMDTLEFDADLALEIWVWCICEFYPYQKYSTWPGDVVTCMDEHIFDCPDSFVQTLISRVAEEEWLCKALMTASKEYRYFVTHLISVALRNEDGQTAEKLFSAYIGGHTTDKDVYRVIEGIIDECSNWEEKESLELFRDRILPIAAEYPKNARVTNGIKKWTNEVNEHIEAVESSAEKYAYSGRYAWRTAFSNSAECGINPRLYETEEEYIEQLQERKYLWRRRRTSIAGIYELDVNEFETQEEFESVLGERIALARKKRQEQRDIERRKCEMARRKPDPLATTDKTVYYFCGVVFLNSEAVYRYRMQDASLSIGDLVVAPIGKEREPLVGKIVSIEQHTRKSSPLLVDEAQFILGRYLPDERETTSADD